LNTALEGKQWLVGDKMSLADVVIATALVVPLQTVLDAGFRKAMKNASDWLARVYALPQFQKVMGSI
jgi:glutathione S-transferase